MRALAIYAGPAAFDHIRQHGLAPQHIAAIAAAAGGPKGLMLLHLDRFLFGQWLPQSAQPIALVGASVGAWRMATACLPDAMQGFAQLENGYIHDDMCFKPQGSRRRLQAPTPAHVSQSFTRNLHACFGAHVDKILHHPRYRLHIITAHGRHLLRREHPIATAAGYAAAYATNAIQRRALGWWLERVVFSSPTAPDSATPAPLPFATHDYRTRHILLRPDNFIHAVQASGSIPFVLQAVHNIPHAPRGAYWDGGITDYHLHLQWRTEDRGDTDSAAHACHARIVLYPHFQRHIIPGWLDKVWTHRHRPTEALRNVLVLAPRAQWIATLPNRKLPDRTDFQTYKTDHHGRVTAWQHAVAASQQLADEWAQWLHKPDMDWVQPL